MIPPHHIIEYGDRIYKAYEYGHTTAIKLLVSNGANTDALMPLSISDSRSDVLEVLLQYGANPNKFRAVTPNMGRIIYITSPIIRAITHDNLDAIKLLLKYGADIDLIYNRDKLRRLIE